LLAGVDHGELVSLAEQYFGNVSLTHEFEIPEFKRCRFTGSEVIILFCAFSRVSFNSLSLSLSFLFIFATIDVKLLQFMPHLSKANLLC